MRNTLAPCQHAGDALVGVLGNQAELLDARGNQRGRLGQQRIPRLRAELAAPGRDCAERARVVTPLGHPQVGGVRGRQPVPLAFRPEGYRRLPYLHTDRRQG